MTVPKLLTAAMLGVMSFSPGALASRDLNQFPSQLPDGSPFPSFSSRARDFGPPSRRPPPRVSPRGSKPPPRRGSSARCSAVSIGYSEVDNTNAIAEAAADTVAYMCSDDGEATAEAAVSATAKAFALAVASSSGSCELSGDASGSIDAYAQAEARAMAWVEAYAEASAKAIQCNKCEAFVYGWGHIQREVFLEAVASAKVGIDAYADGGRKIIGVLSTQKSLEEAVVTAYAEALAGAKAVYGEHECAAWGTSEGCIYTVDDPEGACVECVMSAVSIGAISEIDAIADASTDAVAYTCGEDAVAYADTSVTAKAIAEATAIAVSLVHVKCETAEGGYACADVGTHIESSAKAVAEAFATAWASALTCSEECTVEVESTVTAISDILVKAASEAYGSVCAAEGTAWTVLDFQAQIETGYLEALAEAVATAFSSNSPAQCAAAVTVDSYAGP